MTYRKFHNKPCEVDGIHFDSLAEARHYSDLKLWEMAGEISALRVHPVYQLQPRFKYKGKWERAITYEADFEYHDIAGRVVVIDVKGVETEVFKLKRKLFLNLYPEYYFDVVKV